MALINCPECGGKISDTVKSCIHCGYNLNPPKQIETKNCPSCGLKVKTESNQGKHCDSCGHFVLPDNHQNKTQDSFSKDYEEWKKKESQTNDSSKGKQSNTNGSLNGKQSASVEMKTKELIWMAYTDNKRFQKLPKEIKRPVQIKVIVFCIIFAVVGFGSIPYIAQPIEDTQPKNESNSNYDVSRCTGNGTEGCISEIRQRFRSTGKDIIGEQYDGDGLFQIQFIEYGKGTYNASVRTNCDCEIANVNVTPYY